MRAHPAAVDRLLAGDAVLVAGVGAAIAAGADLVAVQSVPEVYVAADVWPSLARRLHLAVEATNPAVRVRIPVDVWPFDHHNPGPAALAADLPDADDPRAIRAGHQMLAAAAQRALATAPAGEGRG